MATKRSARTARTAPPIAPRIIRLGALVATSHWYYFLRGIELPAQATQKVGEIIGMNLDTRLAYVMSLVVRIGFVLLILIAVTFSHGTIARIVDALLEHHLAPLIFIACGFLALVLRIVEKRYPDARLIHRSASRMAGGIRP